jgi:hypothetical protein
MSDLWFLPAGIATGVVCFTINNEIHVSFSPAFSDLLFRYRTLQTFNNFTSSYYFHIITNSLISSTKFCNLSLN